MSILYTHDGIFQESCRHASRSGRLFLLQGDALDFDEPSWAADGGLKEDPGAVRGELPRTKKAIAVEVDHVVRLFRDPDFCFPRQAWDELLVGFHV